MTMTKVMTRYDFYSHDPRKLHFALISTPRHAQTICAKTPTATFSTKLWSFYRVSVLKNFFYPTQDVYCSSFKCNLGLINQQQTLETSVCDKVTKFHPAQQYLHQLELSPYKWSLYNCSIKLRTFIVLFIVFH